MTPFVVVVPLVVVPVVVPVAVVCPAFVVSPAVMEAAGVAMRTSPGPGLTPICGTKTPAEGVAIGEGLGVTVEEAPVWAKAAMGNAPVVSKTVRVREIFAFICPKIEFPPARCVRKSEWRRIR